MQPKACPDTATCLLPADSAFTPDTVESPLIVYPRQGTPWIAYPHADEEHFVRASFDRWDALRVSRGEVLPYETSDLGAAIFVVDHSRWLQERYDYERRHYGTAYGFGGDVNEMLEEFEHFLFRFHDENVEVIAGGVYFEVAAHPFDLDTPLTQVGRDELPEAYTVDRLEAHGIPMQIRKDPRAPAALLAASRLCDQSLYQLALELDGETSVTHRLTVRTQRGATKSRWRSFGRVDATFDGVLADPRELRPLILRYAAEVADRRRTMGHR